MRFFPLFLLLQSTAAVTSLSEITQIVVLVASNGSEPFAICSEGPPPFLNAAELQASESGSGWEMVADTTIPSDPSIAECYGYSIELLDEVFRRILPNTPRRFARVANNGVMVDSLLTPECSVDSSVLCIGAADTSITYQREQIIDYLSTHFATGLMILTKTKRDLWETVRVIAVRVLDLLLWVIIFTICIIMLIAPLVWLFEMNGTPEGMDPMFMANTANGLEQKRQHIICSTFKNALTWTVYTFMGSELGTPVTPGAKLLGSILGGCKSFMMILLTAAGAAIFTLSVQSVSGIDKFSDLGPSHSVCANTAAPAVNDFVMSKQSTHGYNIIAANTFAGMMTNYASGVCDVAIYDAPHLQFWTTSNGRDGVDGLVGEMLNFDPYGFPMAPGHPLFEAINIATIKVTRDAVFYEALHAKWLARGNGATAQEEGTELFEMMLPYVGVFSGVSLFIAICVCAIVAVKTPGIQKKIAARKRRTYAMLLKEAGKLGPVDIALKPAGDLVHSMALELHEVKTLMLEMMVNNPNNTKQPDGATATGNDVEEMTRIIPILVRELELNGTDGQVISDAAEMLGVPKIGSLLDIAKECMTVLGFSMTQIVLPTSTEQSAKVYVA